MDKKCHRAVTDHKMQKRQIELADMHIIIS